VNEGEKMMALQEYLFNSSRSCYTKFRSTLFIEQEGATYQECSDSQEPCDAGSDIHIC